MKSVKTARICMAIWLVLGMAFLPNNLLNVQASEVIATVQGTVLSGTTLDLLKLSTKEGKMEIKIDSDTDVSECKILLPDTEISVSVSHESDGYLHAVKISTSKETNTIMLDSSTNATVTGTLNENTKGDILYLDTPQGEMQIKLDTTTSMNNCNILVVGEEYSIVCARGSDAYMHAISISDKSISASTGSSHAASMSVTGTVGKSTKESLLYLSTKDGEMQFVIDSDADTRKGMVLVPGNKITVAFYHGSDAYLHAVTIVGEKESSDAKVDTSSLSTVSGTVGSKSTENILFLETKQGTMELKLDAVNSLNKCKVLISGQKLSVTCAYGSDAYMHAIDITAE